MKNNTVLICGGGPCGLTASYLLSRFGIPNLVVEKHPGTSNHPKARGISLRTMELMHVWGLEDKVRKNEVPPETNKIIWMDEITGRVLGEVSTHKKLSQYSPTTECLVPQNFFEEALLDGLASSEYSKIHFSTEMLSYEQHDDHILCHLLDKRLNKKFSVSCAYMIAADGAHSPIRNTLNIPMLGNPSLGRYLTIYVKADLLPWLADKLAAIYAFAGKDQKGRFLRGINCIDDWVFGKRLEEDHPAITEEYCKDVIYSFMKTKNLALDLINFSIWDMAALNAERYQHDRIFLIGDAAHRLPPTGGMGMNTGLADAHNLAWKLAYVLKAYADKSLLTTYQPERQPIADYTLKWSDENAKRIFKMVEAYQEGKLDLFDDLLNDQNRHVNHLGLDLGLVYCSDAVYCKHQTPVNVDSEHYTASSTPGMRAPHCEIRINGAKKSILNLYQQKFVLLLSEKGKVEPNELPIPDSYPLLTYRHKVDFDDLNQDFIKNYEADRFQAILVRPDGHIAWRK